MKRRFLATSIAATWAAILVCSGPSASLAQDYVSDDIPSVSVHPANTTGMDPNSGQWFFTELNPGDSGSLVARITNVAEVPQRVKIFVADLIFADDGRVSVRDGTQRDVGLWGRFSEPNFVMQPGETVHATFEILVPKDADPGDHLGALVAETAPYSPKGQPLNVIKRVATRLYVTVPGDATRAFQISMIRKQVDSSLWPKEAVISVNLRNTGRIRLHPKVSVAGVEATGPEILLSQSVETYIATLRIPWYGGYIKLPTVAEGDDGLIRRVDTSMFVIPWLLIFMLLAAGGLGWLVYRWYQRRASRLAHLQADIRRLESLVAMRPTGAIPTLPDITDTEEFDEVAALMGAIKRARRTGATHSLPPIALSLHASGANALDVLLESLPYADASHRGLFIEAIRSYGSEVSKHPRTRALPEELNAAVSAPSVKRPSPRKTGPNPPKGAARKPVKTSHTKRS